MIVFPLLVHVHLYINFIFLSHLFNYFHLFLFVMCSFLISVDFSLSFYHTLLYSYLPFSSLSLLFFICFPLPPLHLSPSSFHLLPLFSLLPSLPFLSLPSLSPPSLSLLSLSFLLFLPSLLLLPSPYRSEAHIL